MSKPNMRRFTIDADYLLPISGLADDEAGRLFKAMLSYAAGEDLPEMGVNETIAFRFIKIQMDMEREHYQKKCEINRMNGMNGGRPKKSPQEQVPDQSKGNEYVKQDSTGQILLDLGGREEGQERASPQKQEEQKPEKKHYAEFVTLTEAEYERLKERYGKSATDRMIEILDNYKGLNERNKRRYTSDYRAILNWVTDRYYEEQQRKRQRREGQITAGDCNADSDEDWERFYREGYDA